MKEQGKMMKLIDEICNFELVKMTELQQKKNLKVKTGQKTFLLTLNEIQ